MALRHIALTLALACCAHAAPLACQGESTDAGTQATGANDLRVTAHAGAALRSPLALNAMFENVLVGKGRFRVDAEVGPLVGAEMLVSPALAFLEIPVRDAGSKGDTDRRARGGGKLTFDKSIAACWRSAGDDCSNPAFELHGSADVNPLEVRANNQSAAHFKPNALSPSVLRGSPSSAVHSGNRGAMVADRMPPPAVAPSPTRAEEVVTRSHALDHAIQAGDVTTAAELYTDDFLLTAGAGRFKGKHDMLRDITAPDLHLEINATSEILVRVHADAAVLTGVLRQKGRHGNQEFDVRLRVTDTWVRDSVYGWRLLAGHASPLPE
jgi:ketosteroid isomerase-like protein